MKKFNAIDLFCGAGGLSLGFQQAGFNIIVGVDNEQAALDTFEFNHKGAIGLNADLSKRETFDLILKTAGDRKIDVVIAGPPCQGFSLTGPRNFDDPMPLSVLPAGGTTFGHFQYSCPLHLL